MRVRGPAASLAGGQAGCTCPGVGVYVQSQIQVWPGRRPSRQSGIALLQHTIGCTSPRVNLIGLTHPPIHGNLWHVKSGEKAVTDREALGDIGHFSS